MRIRIPLALLLLASCRAALVAPGPEALRVAGRVADSDSVALAGVPVAAWVANGGCGDGAARDSAVTRTGADGRWTATLRRPAAGAGACAGWTALPPADSFWAPATARRDSLPAASAVDLGELRLPEARLVFDFYAPRTPASPGPEAVSVRWNDGSGWREATGREFTTERYAVPHSRTIRLRMADSVRVEVALAAGDTVRGAVTLPIREDWIWGIGIHVARSSPVPMCFGCSGARSWPLRAGAPGDSLFLVWGGNSILRPAVY